MDSREHGAGLTLAEKTSERMIAYIVEQELQPGQKLGTEMEMSLLMGVGRSTVREAIKILVSRNILEVRQGSGTYVSGGKGIADDALGLRLIPDRFKLTWDLQEIRMLLEPDIAYMAAQHVTQAQLQEMEALCDRAEEMSMHKKERLEEDVRFHICIAEASGNLVAPNLIPVIRQAVELFVHYTKREKTLETFAKHRDILEGLKRHDPQWAKDMMTMHLTYNRQELRRVAMERGEILTPEKIWDESRSG